MSKIDLTERLSQMVRDAEKQASANQQAITRQAAAKGMLGSGNFFIDSKLSLEQTFAEVLGGMAEYTLTMTSPRIASKLVRRFGEDMESNLTSRLQLILNGNVSGNPCPGGGASLLSDFTATLRQTLINTVSDTSCNFGRGYANARGCNAFLHRNGWKIVTACLGVAGLFLSWLKL